MEAHKVVPTTKKITVVIAALAIGIAFGAAAIGNLVRMSQTLMGLMLGPLLAVNLLGMLTKRTNWQGAAISLGSF
jgi:Na+/proline symporter